MIMESSNNIIYQGNSIISIENLPDYSPQVVVKQSSKMRSSRRIPGSLEREYEMTRSLDSVEGVRKALGQKLIDNQQVLFLEYIEGETLQDHMSRNKLDLLSKLEIAIDIARILGKIHKQNIIHLDINSKNILIGKKRRELYLIDLGSAALIDRDGKLKVKSDQPLGNLPYISPEQTGRINRALDERSDLYSLGVVLYELMTGQLPFDLKDPMELVHHHLARIPDSPSEVTSEVPEVLSTIILKLLSKGAEDRYQSAAGVQADLDKCLQHLSPEGTISEFPLGEADYSSWLRFPQKLYGRESELKELESAFDGACRETSKIMFVSGYSGIGKTVLVEEIHRPVSEKRGYFIEGKFDQYLRTTPYIAMTQAFTAFVSQMLAEPKNIFDEWRNKIQAEVGDLGGVLTEIIPNLEEVIGVQPEVPRLEGQAAEHRFNYAFINFLSTVATKEHPLALFIDDLQWIDMASLKLLKVILSEFNQPGLLIIGAYRDNEVERSHPLMEIISNQEKTRLPLILLKLGKLQPQHIEKLLSDALRSRKGIKALGRVIYEKTEGNPFFSRRLLSFLYEEGRIHYDSELNGWKWDIRDIKNEAIADNVANLLAQNIARLPEDIRNILTLAACMGNRFDSRVLALVSGLGEQEVIKRLGVALSGHYIFASDSAYQFVHDQVQQAGYALIAEKERPRMHLKIGRTLVSGAAGGELEEALFDIVYHFNNSAPLLESESEKVTVAELNLKAARKSKSATAYAEGFAYVMQGLALLDTESWHQYYDLTLAIHNEAAELSYLTGQYDRAKEFEEHIHQNAQSILDRARIYYIRTMIDTDQGRLLESIETGIGALAELGITIPRDPGPEDAQRAKAAFTETLATRSIEDLAYLPEMTERGALAAMEIMAAVLLNAYIASPQHLSLLTYQGSSLSLQHGNGPWSPFFYSVVGLLWAGEVDISPTVESAGALEAAKKLAKVVFRLLENPRYACCKAKSLDAIMAVMVWHWSMKQLWDLSLEIYQAGLDTGDLLTAGLGPFHLANLGLLLGMNLNDYLMTVTPYRQLVNELGQDYMYRLAGIGLQTAQNLMTPCSEPDVLEEQHFDEPQWLPDAVAANDGLTLFLVFQAKLLLSYHFDRDGRLIKYIGETEKYLDSGYAMINIGFFRFYESLSRLRLCRRLSTDERDLALKRVESNQLRMRIWARSSPMTCQHKYDLVEAELARVSGNIGPAMENYERAIEGARDNAFVHEEALASELYARFWQERGNDKIAEMYMREACALYHHWGASAKVDHIEKRYPQWFETTTIHPGKLDSAGRVSEVHTTITQTITPIQLDIESIISASQMLSAETDLEQLLTRMMTLVMANSGAETAVLLLKQDNDWFVQARGDVSLKDPEVLHNQPFDSVAAEDTGSVPESVHLYCQRSKEVLIVGDARSDNRFAKDKTVQARNIKSMACIPVMVRGECKSMLYLENCQITNTFRGERIELLRHLSSQFGISVENALLYANLSQKIEALGESELRFRSVVENANEAIVVTQDEVVKYCNPKISELTGYSQEVMLSQGFDVFIHPGDMEEVLREYRARLSGERPRSSYSIRIIVKNGQEKHVFINSALVDWAGRPATLAMITDVTELKHAEIEAREQREVLARVGRATKMGQLTGSIAHELNQPLTGILSNAQAVELLIKNGNLDSDEFTEIIEEIIANTKRAGEVIRNLRELYSEQKGEYLPVDINTAVDDTTKLLHSELIKQHIVLTTQCTPSIPLVKGNRIQIQQVLVNLITNSIQAMKDTVDDNRRIHIATKHDENEVKVQVEDGGTGIDEDKIEIIFEPLVTWKPGGTGMGLAINNSIIEAHGGRMWAENRIEGGACVGFVIPALKEGLKA